MSFTASMLILRMLAGASMGLTVSQVQKRLQVKLSRYQVRKLMLAMKREGALVSYMHNYRPHIIQEYFQIDPAIVEHMTEVVEIYDSVAHQLELPA